MPALTKPPGPRTAFSHPKCYANLLRDCGHAEANRSGNPIEREHFVSKSLQERFGKPFLLDGLSWATNRLTMAEEVAAKVLCARHNRALSPLDSFILKFDDVLVAYRAGRSIGWLTLDGEDLERWAIKALCGGIASGTVLHRDGRRVPAEMPPEPYLRFLFGYNELPPGLGFHYITTTTPISEADADLLNIIGLKCPIGHEHAGAFFGVFVKLGPIQFLVSMAINLTFTDPLNLGLHYRPLGIQFADLGCVRLRWSQTPSRTSFVLPPSHEFWPPKE
jgi:hypothetical protein